MPACSGTTQASVSAMSAMNGSGTSRLKRSQNIAIHARAAAVTSCAKASQARQFEGRVMGN